MGGGNQTFFQNLPLRAGNKVLNLIRRQIQFNKFWHDAKDFRILVLRPSSKSPHFLRAQEEGRVCSQLHCERWTSNIFETFRAFFSVTDKRKSSLAATKFWSKVPLPIWWSTCLRWSRISCEESILDITVNWSNCGPRQMITLLIQTPWVQPFLLMNPLDAWQVHHNVHVKFQTSEQ